MQQNAGYYKTIARDALRGRWGIAILVSFIAGLLGAGSNTYGQVTRTFESQEIQSSLSAIDPRLSMWLTSFLISFGIILTLIGLAIFVIGGAVELGEKTFYLRLITGAEARFDALFGRFHILLKALLLRLYMGLFIFLWSLLLFIPGIIAAYRYAMAPYIMAENPDIGVVEAVNRSKAMMQGNKALLFWLHLSFIGWILLCVLSLGIGSLWLAPYMKASETAFYLELNGIRQSDPAMRFDR